MKSFIVVNKSDFCIAKIEVYKKNFLTILFIRTISFYIDNKINTFQKNIEREIKFHSTFV